MMILVITRVPLRTFIHSAVCLLSPCLNLQNDLDDPERGMIFVCSATHKTKSMFFFLAQTEQGDIFKVTLETDEEMVSITETRTLSSLLRLEWTLKGVFLESLYFGGQRSRWHRKMQFLPFLTMSCALHLGHRALLGFLSFYLFMVIEMEHLVVGWIFSMFSSKMPN